MRVFLCLLDGAEARRGKLYATAIAVYHSLHHEVNQMAEKALENSEELEPTPVEEQVKITLAGEDEPTSNQVPEHVFRKKINKLNSRVETAKAEKTEAEKRAEMLEAENQLLRSQRLQGGKPQTDQEPRLEDFDTDEEYRAAHQQWDTRRIQRIAQENANQLLQQNQQKAQQEAAIQAQEAKLIDHFKRANESQFPNYEAAEDKAVDVLGQDMARLIMAQTDDSVKTMYLLGSYPEKAEEFKRLIQSNPIGGLMKLGAFVNRAQIERVTNDDLPSPDESINGGTVVPEGGYQKRLDKMRENGSSVREILAFKKEARAAGVNIY